MADVDAAIPKTNEECIEIIDELLKHSFDATHIPTANVTEGSAFDPFASTVAPITKDIHSTLTYFWIHAPAGLHHYKLEVLPEHLRPFQESLQSLRESPLTYVFERKHVFHPFLAAYQSRIRLFVWHESGHEGLHRRAHFNGYGIHSGFDCGERETRRQ